MADEEGPKIVVTVKTPKEKQDVEIGADGGIKEFKDLVAKKFGAPVEQLCLIFAGKILKDGETLAQHGIKDGLTVHLVIKSANRTQDQSAQRPAASPEAPSPAAPSTQAPNVGQTPFGLGGLGGLSGLGNMGMGSANFMEMQQRMQRELMGNPDMLRQMMENPFVQQLMSNPDIMRQMITSNPQMRELMERNPEISHMLNNPELMRQTMELARNPAMLQELMRSQDRAMSNLESIPGGFNALQRMYRDVQEPMMDAAFGNQNPFASLVSQNSGPTQQGRENTDPLPNPWTSSGSTNTTSQTTSPTSTTTTSTSSSSTTSGPTGTPGPAGMFNSPGMQSLMQQMSQNPQLMENMLQAPYMQAMLQSMSSNPEMASQIIGSNPMFAGNPQLQQQLQQQLPNMLQQMQNPEVQSFMSNPRALQAMMQIQQGMSALQSEAPGLFPGLNPMVPPVVPTASTPNPASPATTSNPTSPSPTSTDATSNPASPAAGTTTTAGSTATTTTTTGTTPSTAGGTTPQNPDQLTNLMAHMMQMMAGGNINQPPEQRYASQLEQLATMGFVDREANIRALQATLGDVNAAIDRLLQQR